MGFCGQKGQGCIQHDVVWGTVGFRINHVKPPPGCHTTQHTGLSFIWPATNFLN